MIKLYYHPSNASMTPHMVLNDTGAPFDLILVDRANNQHKGADYLKLNPTGTIPTLIDGDLVLHETAAIVLHLCDKFPAAGLAPPSGSTARAIFYKWLIYLTNTVQPTLMAWFYPERYTADPAAAPAVKQSAADRLDDQFALLDRSLAAAGPYLLGPDFSAADYMLYMLVRWGRGLPRPARDFPNLRRHADLVLARPAAQKMLAVEKLAEVY